MSLHISFEASPLAVAIANEIFSATEQPEQRDKAARLIQKALGDLEADLAAEQEKTKQAWQEHDDLADGLANFSETIKQLGARNKQLRAALESIAANTCCEKCQEAALVARQALSV